MLKHITSIWNRYNRNNINNAIDHVNMLGKTIQDLVAEGQLTEEQYAELLITINSLVKSGNVDKSDLTPEFKGEIEGFNAQLAETETQKADKEELQSGLNRKRDKTVPIGLNDVGTDLLAAVQNKEGETTFNILSIPQHDSVSPTKTTFVKRSSNLFNSESVSAAGYLIGTDGSVSESGTYTYSDMIEVIPYAPIYLYGFLHVAQYDMNKQFLRRITVPVYGEAFTPPEDCYYIRLNYQHTSSLYQDVRRVNEGTELLPYEDWYQHMDEVLPSSSLTVDAVKYHSVKDGELGIEKMSFMKRSSNLFNIDTILERTNITASGTIIDSTSYHLSDYIRVKPSYHYSSAGIAVLAEFDENKNFIQRSNLSYSVSTFTTTAKTHYIRGSYQFNSSLAGEGITRVNEGSVLLPYEDFSVKFEKNLELDSLNEVIEKDKDRVMIDVPINGVFDTNETYDDYTDFNNVTSSDTYLMFDDLTSLYPNYITKEFLGNDSVGNSISAYHFSPSIPSSDIVTKIPKVFITCGVHGYEKASTLVTYLMLKQMCEKWDEYPLLEALRFNVKFIVIPVANPTGWNVYERQNINGIDINRNFPIGWVSGETSGTEPLSELESKYIKSVFDNNKDIDVMFDFHNFHSSEGGRTFLWVPTPNAYSQHMAQNLISRTTRKWSREFDFIPENEFVGTTSTGAKGTIATYARSLGIKYASTFEICNIWQLDPNGSVNDHNVTKAGVESLVNWTLINLRELTR